MKRKDHDAQKGASEKLYDFSGPLWSNYFRKTRSNARFPRGYREVFSIEDSELGSEAN